MAAGKWSTSSTANWETYAASYEVTAPLPVTSPATRWPAVNSIKPTALLAISAASYEVTAPLWSEARGLPNLGNVRTVTLPSSAPSEYVPAPAVVASAVRSPVSSIPTSGTGFALGSAPEPSR